MTTVELDITLAQLETIGWQEGDLIKHSGATWQITNVTRDGRMDVAWVTMKKLQT